MKAALIDGQQTTGEPVVRNAQKTRAPIAASLPHPSIVKNTSAPVISLGNASPAPALRAKLTINQPGDQFEQEADRVAQAAICAGAVG